MNKLIVLFLATATLSLTSCLKSQDDTLSAITLDEAADIISTSVSKNAVGITTSLEGSVEGVDALESTFAPTSMMRATGVDTIKIDTVFAYPAIYSNTIHYEYCLLFDTESNPYIPVSYTSEGFYEGPRISSTHTGSGAYTLTNFYGTTCTVNGNFNRWSNQQSKVLLQRQSNASATLECVNIVVDKATHLIQSGTINVDIEGTVVGKGNFIYNAVITYQGANTASMVVEGKIYTLNLETGVYSAVN